MELNLETLTSISNIRDIGGYKTTGGKTISCKKLVRSACLDKLSRKDANALTRYGIKTIIDFRSIKERQNTPDKEIIGINNLPFPIFDDVRIPVIDNTLIERLISKREKLLDFLPYQHEHMIETYRNMVCDKNALNTFQGFFKMLLEIGDHDGAVLFHCTAGKDRTGFAAALVLKCLGVDWNDILKDYLVTNNYIQEQISRVTPTLLKLNISQQMIEQASGSFLAKKEYLDAAFQMIDSKYGNFYHYMGKLGVDKNSMAKLKDIYTK